MHIRQSRSSTRDGDFEWDDRKAAANLARHGVSFDTARRVFADPFVAELEDRREAYGEERRVALGMVQDRVLAVVYTWRGERIRIISARLAEPFERKLYHEANRET